MGGRTSVVAVLTIDQRNAASEEVNNPASKRWWDAKIVSSALKFVSRVLENPAAKAFFFRRSFQSQSRYTFGVSERVAVERNDKDSSE